MTKSKRHTGRETKSMFNLTNKQAKMLDELITMEKAKETKNAWISFRLLANVNMIISSRKEVMKMAYRRKARRGDHRMFMRTAGTTKQINITPKIMRGGIRL